MTGPRYALLLALPLLASSFGCTERQKREESTVTPPSVDPAAVQAATPDNRPRFHGMKVQKQAPGILGQEPTSPDSGPTAPSTSASASK
jgi:hypothetical protein